MNPAQMVLQAEPARGLDRTDHTHTCQSDRRFGARGRIWYNMPAAWNLAGSRVLLTSGIRPPQ